MPILRCFHSAALLDRAPGARRVYQHCRKWAPPRNPSMKDQSWKCRICRKRITANRGKVCDRCLKGKGVAG